MLSDDELVAITKAMKAMDTEDAVKVFRSFVDAARKEALEDAAASRERDRMGALVISPSTSSWLRARAASISTDKEA